MTEFTEQMLDLARDLYRTAEDYRDLDPDISDRMVGEADEIVRQFGPVDLPEEDPPAPVLRDDPDPTMENVLEMMRTVMDKPEPMSVPAKKPGLFGSIFGDRRGEIRGSGKEAPDSRTALGRQRSTCRQDTKIVGYFVNRSKLFLDKYSPLHND